MRSVARGGGWTAAVTIAAALGASIAIAQVGSAVSAQGRGGPPGGAPVPFEDRTGFREIFDGRTMGQWDGNPEFWRVENGAIVGETTKEHPLEVNTFIVWRGGEPADFELKLEFRINATNSGVQYRSVALTDVGRWVLKGYQADIDFNNQYTGMLYEERGRAFLAPRGTFGYVGPGQPAPGTAQARGSATPAGVRGPIGALENGDALKAYIRQNDWNQFHVVARGNVLVHVLNGHVTALFVDDDPVGRAMKGLIGLQLHVGDPMKVEFRNIWLKTL
ncbi:MAG: DUF1080 domain-containing protein [Acidobacteria bacterium]|nr:DUF1080 domain-containing protein [Acidobacteriota bacterium]